MIIAVDFDGVLCKDCFPSIGEPNLGIMLLLIQARIAGHRLILWTCRENVTKDGELHTMLTEAIEWCKGFGLEFDAVNKNLPSEWDEYEGQRRKVTADIYIEDKIVGFDINEVEEFLYDLCK